MKRNTMEFTIFVNGKRKVSMTARDTKLCDLQQKNSSELWGVLDVYGAVRSVRLKGPNDRHCSVPAPVPLLRASDTRDFGMDLAPTQDLKRPAPDSLYDDTQEVVEAGAHDLQRPSKRPRLPMHPCGCAVHLIGHEGKIVHVSESDFMIGRNRKAVHLVLDSTVVPNMVSRNHARILSSSDCVEIVDCNSVNGTWVNSMKVKNKQELKQDDIVVIGNPGDNISSAEFRFSVSMPPLV